MAHASQTRNEALECQAQRDHREPAESLARRAESERHALWPLRQQIIMTPTDELPTTDHENSQAESGQEQQIVRRLILGKDGVDLYFGAALTISVNPMHIFKIEPHELGSLITVDASLCGQRVESYVITEHTDKVRGKLMAAVKEQAVASGRRLRALLA